MEGHYGQYYFTIAAGYGEPSQKLGMSRTERIETSAGNYLNLLGFLNDKHPDILKEWSNGLTRATTNGTECHEQREVNAHDT